MNKGVMTVLFITFLLVTSIGFVSAGFGFGDDVQSGPAPPTIGGDDARCETSSDCGEPSDQLVCVGNEVKRLQANPICVFNRCSASDPRCRTNYCYSSTSSTTVEVCEFGCLDGVCVSEPICGNGVLESGEECDDSNLIDGDGCSSSCLIEAPSVCGNGIVEGTEQCDDGNNVVGDGCNPDCRFGLSLCGNGVCEPELGENVHTCSRDCVVIPTGESTALFGGTKIYMGDSLNKVKKTLTKANLPTVLADGQFNGNVDRNYVHKIILGSNPRVVFAKQPTGDEDPQVVLDLSTTASNFIYNMSITFDRAVDFTHPNSFGKKLSLFGNNYFISSRTSNNRLVLLKEANKLFLSVGGDNPNPSEKVTIETQEYLVELVGATDFSATIKIIGPSGEIDVVEIDEASHRIVQGVEVAVLLADESQTIGVISASILVGAQVLTLTDGSEVTIGSSDTAVDNTNVGITGGLGAVTRISIEVAAQEDDTDSINIGGSFVDPVFGSFKIEFPGLNIGSNDFYREDISIKNSGSARMVVSFNDYNRDRINNFQWVYNKTDASGGGMRLASSNKNIIHVVENEPINRSQYVMIGNENNGGLYQITTLLSSTTEFKLTMTDVFSGETSTVTGPRGSNIGTITLKGYDYTYNFVDASTSAAKTIRLNYPDSTGNDIVIYPTIQTLKGAKFAFYEPIYFLEIEADTSILIPDGDGYARLDVGSIPAPLGPSNFKVSELEFSVDRYDILGKLFIDVVLKDVSGNQINQPAIVIFEEKDDNNVYNALIVELDSGYDGDNAGIGIKDVERTWSSDLQWDDIQLESDNDIYQEIDFLGSIITVDKSDSDQAIATISYPDSQIYAQLFISSLLDDPLSCTTDEDCPSETERFCDEYGSACGSTINYYCSNNQCVAGGGGGWCSFPCSNGCFAGSCLPGPIPTDCENSCEFQNGCIPYGIRQSFNDTLLYCDIDDVMKVQLPDNDVCDNDYECVSNVCTNGECFPLKDTLETQTSFLRTIFCWVTNPFNKQDRAECLLGYDPAGSEHDYIIEEDFGDIIYDESHLIEGINQAQVDDYVDLFEIATSLTAIDGAKVLYNFEEKIDAVLIIAIEFDEDIAYSDFDSAILSEFIIGGLFGDYNGGLEEVGDVGGSLPNAQIFIITRQGLGGIEQLVIWSSENKFILIKIEDLESFPDIGDNDDLRDLYLAYIEKYPSTLIVL